MGDDTDFTALALALGAGLVFMSIGGYLFYDEYALIVASEDVEANVLSSSVSETGGIGEDKEYYISIRYEYTYEGETYTSDNVFAGESVERVSNRGKADTLMDEYAEGATVTAHVDPADPSEAYLETKAKNPLGYLFFIVLGALSFGFGLDELLGELVGVSLLIFGRIR